ncbi:coiled-coil domain-containing protein 177-like [Gigantopelta aegis]|uniref:coiled-coil domain-containing protein 177-like n=1 Tax=Gigantopelta aegis TaxID=1735272 RepID=UPI001B88BBD1|nr:coiled-coil domain-containing protein 177-like [Gigantopelta aegis]
MEEIVETQPLSRSHSGDTWTFFDSVVKDTCGSVSITHTPLKLDLYNFEEPQYEGSKFVLTSPRSLEACSRLGTKPVDLFYKPLAEFQEELLPQDIPLRTIYNIYDEQEQTRLSQFNLV